MNGSLCNRVAEAMQIQEHTHTTAASFVEAALEDSTVPGFKEYDTWISSAETSLALATKYRDTRSVLLSKPVCATINDSQVKHSMTYLERLSQGTEVLLHQQGEHYPKPKTLRTCQPAASHSCQGCPF